ncbi:olfactory receptor 10AG1-like [Dendropsophus ebraccatus]|uniref:olfactory receptor 10AG1-like n=1 Tax=Dendropsophus ebraccatus TaxID=150705 RepID=UPI003831EF5C
MSRGNHTTKNGFTLVGFSDVPELQYFLFSVFLSVFFMSLSAHMFLIVLYRFSKNLHTPMYFFLANFSFLEICYISTVTPKMLVNLLSGDKSITFYGCAVQTYCFLLLASTECYILAAMAYDRYNAICHPLLYNITVNREACIKLIVGSWSIGLMIAIIQTFLTFSLPFCGPNKINHFYCDIPPIMALACTDTKFNEIITFVLVLCVVVGAFLLIMVSYIQITWTIVKHHSIRGIRKAFSTCTSHLIVVIIFYGSASVMYLRPKSSYGTDGDKFISLMYTIIAPLLNPFIYSLRNNDVKVAVKKLMPKIKIRTIIFYKN